MAVIDIHRMAARKASEERQKEGFAAPCWYLSDYCAPQIG